MDPGSIAAAVGGDIAGALITGHFNAREADKNRDFQSYMSGTAYQRAAKDLEAAGLNRILALGNGASTPGGSTATMPSMSLGSTGIAAASAKSAIQLQEEQKALVEQQRKVAEEQELLVKNQGIEAYAKAHAAMKYADPTAAAELAAKLASGDLAAHNARSAAVEAQFQEGLGDTGKLLYQFMKDIGLGGVPAKIITKLPLLKR